MAHVSTLPSSAEGGSHALIALRNARKGYGRRSVLEIDNFEIFEGNRIELIGSNASGKSTLTRLLAGTASLTSGRIERSETFAKGRIGLLSQSGGCYRELTVMQNVIAIARLFGRRGELNRYSESILFDLDLMEYLDHKVKALSGGYQRLCALASLICARPAALILDEPFAGMDESKVASIRGVLASDRYSYSFILVTGHESRSVFPGGRIISIRQGRISDEKYEVAAP